ncbi:MAG: FAD-dependent oxidoreductase [Proteobacteria bacterium]|nr:FAD-dependent oxidoreductase [Pseudomonadota bacterium]
MDRRARQGDVAGARGVTPVVVVGAGPVGLALAIDLAQRGVPVRVLDDGTPDSTEGSRAICWSRRTLAILHRLGCAEAIAAHGVQWNTGRVFFGDHEVYAFDLTGDASQRWPAFVNLQQYEVERELQRRAAELPLVDLRWRHRVAGVTPGADGVHLDVHTPDGPRSFAAPWVVACDGARSPVRGMLGLEREGQVFRDRFLIADIRMEQPFPAERWFWFDPPFHRHQSALLHKQADNVWRLDFQLGYDADPERERAPDAIAARVRAMLGADVRYTLVWASVYTFACRRMARFRHGRVLFAGDAAHVVSPFGARGANSGIEDADNLGWKLAAVVQGHAPEPLLDSYDVERVRAADENILQSTRSTDFITPKSPVSRVYRDAVLALARHHPFARALVNSGRLSVPAVLDDSPLNTPAPGASFAADAPAPGSVAPDVVLPGGGALHDRLGARFALLLFAADGDAAATAIAARLAPAVERAGTGCDIVVVNDAVVARRYGASPGTCYLVRPDRHICARWPAVDPDAILQALLRAHAAGVHA